MRREATATEIATAIAERLEEHAEQLRSSRELRDAREAAEFLRLPYSEFKRTPSSPHHATLRLSQERAFGVGFVSKRGNLVMPTVEFIPFLWA